MVGPPARSVPCAPAPAWLADVARQLGTDDRHAAHRMLRAWLHTLRDRLPVNAAVDFAAQLPEFFRGVFYDGWQPSRVPAKYGPDEYRQRFAQEAQIPVEDVDAAAAAVTAALRARLSPGQVDHALQLLARPVRRILQGPAGAGAARPPLDAVPGDRPGSGSDAEVTVEERLARLEKQVANVAGAVSVLAHGLEQLPTEDPNAQRAGQAARRAYELLIAASVNGD
jgi:uncharacterized protein (DUF2267 family)